MAPRIRQEMQDPSMRELTYRAVLFALMTCSWKLPFLFNPMGIQSYQRQVSGAKNHQLLDFSLPWRDLEALSPSILEDGQCDDNSDNSKRGFKGALCVVCET